MDYMAITTDNIKNYIPLGYKKEDPENFYHHILYDHSIWMDTVRHVTITNVPTFEQFKKETNHEGTKTLNELLDQIPNIDNVSYIRPRRQVLVATSAKNLRQTTYRITKEVRNVDFAYKPQVAKKFNPTGSSLGSNKSGTSKYSAAMSKYQTKWSPTSSVATSCGEEVSRLTGQTGCSWGTQRKIPREIDFTDATEFPPLHSQQSINNASTHGDTTQPTNHDGSITDTTILQQAINCFLIIVICWTW